MTPFLEVRGMEFAYGAAPAVLRGLDLTCAPRSMTAVIGANGSGKSTLIRLLAALLRPTAGEIRFKGIPLDRWQPRLRAREIAYVPQSMSMAFPFLAEEVVLSGRAPYLDRFRMEGMRDRETAMEALAAVDAAHLARRPYTSLSGGERQMVILARALAQEPKLLLLDEPSAALDLKHRAALIRTLARLRTSRNLCVIMVTHDLQLTGSFFDRILALRCGEAAGFGSPEEILRGPLLAEVYDDPGVRAERIGRQTFVWVEE